MSDLLEEVRGPLAGCRADKEVWDEIERLEAKVAKLEAALTKIAHRDVPDATAHGQVIVAREALEQDDE